MIEKTPKWVLVLLGVLLCAGLVLLLGGKDLRRELGLLTFSERKDDYVRGLDAREAARKADREAARKAADRERTAARARRAGTHWREPAPPTSASEASRISDCMAYVGTNSELRTMSEDLADATRLDTNQEDKIGAEIRMEACEGHVSGKPTWLPIPDSIARP